MGEVLKKEAFIWATGAFCQLNRIPHDAGLLIKQYPPPYTVVNLQQALNGFGLSNSLKSYDLNQLMEYLLSPISKAFHEAGRER